MLLNVEAKIEYFYPQTFGYLANDKKDESNDSVINCTFIKIKREKKRFKA